MVEGRHETSCEAGLMRGRAGRGGHTPGRCLRRQGSDAGQVFVVIVSRLASHHSRTSGPLASRWHYRTSHPASGGVLGRGDGTRPGPPRYLKHRGRPGRNLPLPTRVPVSYGRMKGVRPEAGHRWPPSAVRGRKLVTRLMLYDSLSRS